MGERKRGREDGVEEEEEQKTGGEKRGGGEGEVEGKERRRGE